MLNSSCCSLLHQKLAIQTAQKKGASEIARMGRGESVVLEADVGFKDKEGAFKDTESVLSPHGNGSDSAAANAASHVEDGAQVFLCLSLLNRQLH